MNELSTQRVSCKVYDLTEGNWRQGRGRGHRSPCSAREDGPSPEEMVAVACGVVLTTQENMGCSAHLTGFADVNGKWLVIIGFRLKDLKHHPSPKPLASVTSARERFLL